MTTSTITDPKIASVQRLYAAFGAQDMDGVLAELADDVDWAAEAADNGAPWHGPYVGKAAVPGFFAAIGAALDITEFTVVGFTANETDVIATVHWTFTARATGKTGSMYMQHWWRFDNSGKIFFFRGSEDSAQSLAVLA